MRASRSAEVIVIGGGAAGLAAAAELARKGIGVVLLEARDRLGGRIFTQRLAGWPGPVELGAEFIHSGNAAMWRLVRRHRVPTRPIPPRHWLFREGRLERVDDMERRIARVTNQIDGARMHGWSFADFMRGRAESFAPRDRNLARGFVEGFQAAPPQKMSAAAVEGQTLADEDQFLLPRGYDRLVAAMEAGLDPRLVTIHREAVVTKVAWARGQVEVRAAGQSFSARALIITLPLGVLRARPRARGAVRFEPPLTARAKVAARMGLGEVIRLTLRFDGRRWQRLLPAALKKAHRGGFGFVHSRMAGVPVWWALSTSPILTGWAGGPDAATLARRTDEAILATALRSLARVLDVAPARLQAALLDCQMHNWSSDPFSRGAYSFIAAGHDGAARKLRTAIQNTLFFAGEATADGEEAGTVHGAVASGERAAREVLRARKKGAGSRRPAAPRR